MQRDVIVVENFYQDPAAVVKYAQSLPQYYPYQSEAEVKAGVAPTWTTTRFTDFDQCPFRSSENLIQKLEGITGEPIDRSYWDRNLGITDPEEVEYFYTHFPEASSKRINSYNQDWATNPPSNFECSLWNCAFQTKLAADAGEAVHNHIVDYWQCCGESGWNGIVYLNEIAPARTGLKLWRHKYGDNTEWMTDHDRWELLDDLANVYNRLILFRGKTPHSGSPGFGTSNENGRLFQTFFFRTQQPEQLEPVDVAI